MPTITIDNIDYDLDQLSDEAKAQLASLQFVDQELARLQAQAAALQTARMAGIAKLKGSGSLNSVGLQATAPSVAADAAPRRCDHAGSVVR